MKPFVSCVCFIQRRSCVWCILAEHGADGKPAERRSACTCVCFISAHYKLHN